MNTDTATATETESVAYERVDRIISGLEIALTQSPRKVSFYCSRCPLEARRKARVVLHGESLCLAHARAELED